MTGTLGLTTPTTMITATTRTNTTGGTMPGWHDTTSSRALGLGTHTAAKRTLGPHGRWLILASMWICWWQRSNGRGGGDEELVMVLKE